MSYNPYLGEEPPADAYARMDVDDEYEGGQWIDGEFYYEKKRDNRSRHQSKAKQLYGVFAGNDEDDEDEQQSRRNSARRRRGVVMSDDDDEDDDDVGESRRGLGARRGGTQRKQGAGSSLLSRTMKFVGSTAQQTQDDDKESESASQADAAHRNSGAEEMEQEEKQLQEEQHRTGLSFKRRRLAQQQHIQQQKAPDDDDELSAAAASTSASPPSSSAAAAPRRQMRPVAVDRDFAAFTAHSSGAALRMLQKMGFKGRLGKHETGVALPILPVLRPKGAGLGVIKEKKDVRGRNADEEERIEQEAQDRKKKEQQDATRRGEAAAPVAAVERRWRKGEKRVKKSYKTAAELRNSTTSSAVAPTVIIDMTGSTPVQKNIAALSSSTPSPPPSSSTSAVPELQHNVQLLVDLAEVEVQQVERRARDVRREVDEMEQEEERMRVRERKELDAVRRMERVVEEVERMQTALRDKQDGTVEERLQLVEDFLQLMQRSYAREWRMYGVVQVCVVMLFPLIRALVQDWQPLSSTPSPAITAASSRLFSALERWQQHLDDGTSSMYYHDLVSTLLLPPLRLALSSSSLQLQIPAPIVSLFSSLRRVLPAALFHSLTHSLLLPRLLVVVKQYNPRAALGSSLSFLPLYSSVLGDDDMQSLYAVVRQKLTFVLSAWRVEDEAAADGAELAVIDLVEEWLGEWKDDDMAAFLSRYVLAKLINAVAAVRIEVSAPQSSQSALAVVSSIMRWYPLFIPATFSSLLLPLLSRFLAALHAALSRPEPDYEAISTSYVQWKAALTSHGAQTLPVMAEAWKRGLDLINAAIEGDSAAALAWQVVQRWLRDVSAAAAAPTATTSRAEERKEARRAVINAGDGERAAMSYKDVLYALGERHGFDVFPHGKRRTAGAGHDVYMFGAVRIYWTGEDVYAMDDASKQWELVSLNTLLQRAQQARLRHSAAPA